MLARVQKYHGMIGTESADQGRHMLADGILNPALASLLARFRHANSLAVLDGPFPYYENIETVDLTLVRGIPTISQVLDAILPALDHSALGLLVAHEFAANVDAATVAEYTTHHAGLPTTFIPHIEFKQRVNDCVGIIRTADTVPYSNVIITCG